MQKPTGTLEYQILGSAPLAPAGIAVFDTMATNDIHGHRFASGVLPFSSVVALGQNVIEAYFVYEGAVPPGLDRVPRVLKAVTVVGSRLTGLVVSVENESATQAIAGRVYVRINQLGNYAV